MPSSRSQLGPDHEVKLAQVCPEHPSESLLLLSRGHLMMYHLTRKQNFLNVSRQIPYFRNHTGKDLLLYLATDNFVSPNKNEIISCRAGEVVCLIYIDEQREGSRVQTRFPSETSLLAGVNHHYCCTLQLCIAIYLL